EDQTTVSRDSSGYFVGGEARNYGNLIGPLSSYWLSLNNSSNLPGIGQGGGGQEGSPSVPTGLATTGVTTSTVGLSWNASTEQGGSGSITGYHVFRNGAQVGSPAGTSYTDTG